MPLEPTDPIRNDVSKIRAALYSSDANTTVADLVREVREALRGGSSEPTVRASFIELQNTIRAENDKLIAMLRHGGGNIPGGSRDQRGENDTQTEILEKILLAFEGMGGGGAAAGGEGGPAQVFQRQVLLNTFNDIERVFKKFKQGIYEQGDLSKAFWDRKQQQFDATFEGLLNNFVGFGLRMTNLTTTFDKLTHTVRETIGSYGTNVFGSNILGPQEHFFEIVNRVQKGILMDSDSFRTALKTVQTSLEQGLASPLAMTGKTAAQLAEDFSLARQEVHKLGTDLRTVGTTEQNQRWMVDLSDTMNKMGLNTTIHQPIMERALNSQTQFLQKIAANTGLSVDKLEQQLKKVADQNSLMAALGRLRPQELTNFNQAQTAFKNQIGEGATNTLFELFKKVLAGGRPDQPGAIMASSPEFFARLAMVPGAFEATLKALDLIMKGQHEEAMKVVSQFPDIFRNVQELALKQGGFVQEKMLGPATQSIGGLIEAGNLIKGRQAPTAEQKERAEPDWFASLYGKISHFMDNLFKPIFGGLEGAIFKQVVAIAANTGALIALTLKIGALPMLGGAGGSFIGNAARGAARVAGTVAGGAAIGGAVEMLSPPQSTEGAIGGVAGGIGGIIAAGRFIGSLMGGRLGPVGAVIGSAVLGYIGEKIGDYIAGPIRGAAANAVQTVSPAASAPAVPPPENVVGPAVSAITTQGQTATDVNRNFHSEQMQVLSGLLNVGVDGNNLLGQMFAELARQTSALTGQPATASKPLPAHGLSSSAPSLSSPTRAQAAYPYGAVDY